MEISAIQFCPGPDIAANVELAIWHIRRAAEEGASIVGLPEYFSFYGAEEDWADAAEKSEFILSTMSKTAKELKIYILAGSILVPASEGKMHNRSTLFGPDGGVISHYSKTHLFDVNLDCGTFCESRWLVPGADMVTAVVDQWTLGFSICFDVRFPDHFQTLRKMGANVIFVPAAFSMETGEAHWMSLIRARAIETQCYVIAPALVGDIEPSRKCFGHTAIIDPWGKVLRMKKSGEGPIYATFDMEAVKEARRKIPLDFS